MVDPLVFSKLRIENALLQPLELEGKSRAQLLQSGARTVFFLAVDITMMSNKDEITLIVKRDNLAAFELWLVREKRAQKTPRATA